MVAASFAAAGGSQFAAPTPATPKGPTYNTSLTETGLPSGTNWSVKITFLGCGCDGVHGTFTTNGNTLTVGLTNGSYRYTVLPVPNFFSSDSKGLLNVSGAAPAPVTISFQPIVQYSAEFFESGLPAGTNWTVSVTGNGTDQAYALEHQEQSTNNTSMNFSLLNGTYHYVVSKVVGSYFLGRSHGVFVVDGASPPVVVVSFETPAQYTVSFQETGLTAGTNWTVHVGGFGGVRISETVSSTGADLNVSLPNGTYRFTVGEVLGYTFVGASTGHFDVLSSPVTLAVAYAAVGAGGFFPVTFNEVGLSSGHHWHITVVATHTIGHSRSAGQSSNTSSLTFYLQNGTYRYSVPVPRGYTSNTTGGTFTVAGAAVSPINVTFVPIPRYTVTVTESGLAAGTNWSVLVKTSPGHVTPWPVYVTHSSTGSSVTFSLPNGTYCYRIYAVPYYTVSSGTLAGTFTVSGAPTTISIGFTPKG
ncbi:MAG TPA: hypothetical protein VMG36_06860 [Thermoplasmata archaeon]|nr:hypothetical protein [Thermoplasmata archaeon]